MDVTFSEQDAPCPTKKSVTDWPRYFLFLNGKWRWRPTKIMRARGFGLVTFGRDLTDEALERARALNAEWDAARKSPDIRSRPNVIVGEVVYVVGFANYVKIGWSEDLNQRIDELECRLPEVLTIFAVFKGTRRIENALKARFASYRLRGEWFRREGKVAAWVEAGCPLGPERFRPISRTRSSHSI